MFIQVQQNCRELTHVCDAQCSYSKLLSQILKIVVKNFSEIVPGKQTQKEGFRPLTFLTRSMRISLLIIIEFGRHFRYFV